MDQSFLDPLTYKNGEPFGPKRYKEIVRECWFISDQTNTSYADVLDLSYQERMYLIECVADKQKATEKALAQMQAQLDQQKKK